MAKNKKFRKEMKDLTKRLDTLAGYTSAPSEYLRGYDHAVDVINQVIKRELEETK